jgi:hypothetical protein
MPAGATETIPLFDGPSIDSHQSAYQTIGNRTQDFCQLMGLLQTDSSQVGAVN